MNKWLINPFIYIAGAKALLWGWAAMLVTAIIGMMSYTHFDGVIDVHTAGKAFSLGYHLLEQLVDWSCATLLFWGAGVLVSKSSIRLIDVAGTMAFARIPMIFAAIAGYGIKIPGQLKTVDEITRAITPMVIVCSLVSLVFLIWMIAWMYNAFKVSCNIKGGKATVVFIIGLLFSEIISHILLYFISNR